MTSTVEVKCKNSRCGKMFTARIADRKRGWGKFCSKSCKASKQLSHQVNNWKKGCGHHPTVRAISNQP